MVFSSSSFWHGSLLVSLSFCIPVVFWQIRLSAILPSEAKSYCWLVVTSWPCFFQTPHSLDEKPKTIKINKKLKTYKAPASGMTESKRQQWLFSKSYIYKKKKKKHKTINQLHWLSFHYTIQSCNYFDAHSPSSLGFERMTAC